MGQLVGAGSGLVPTANAFDAPGYLFGGHSFRKRGDALQVSVASALKVYALDVVVVGQTQMDGGASTCPVWCSRDASF